MNTTTLAHHDDYSSSSSSDEDEKWNRKPAKRPAPPYEHSSSSSDDGSSDNNALRRRVAALVAFQTMPLPNKTDAATNNQNKHPPPPPTAAAMTKQQRTLQKEQARQQKEQSKLQKDQIKLQKQLDKQTKQDDRDAKKQADLTAKVNRQQVLDAHNQATGKYAKQEILVLIDSSLYHHATLKIVQELNDNGYEATHEHRSLLGSPAIQWIVNSRALGGAQQALEQLQLPNSTVIANPPHELVLIVFDAPLDFIHLLRRGNKDDQDDYPYLLEWLRGIYAGWRAAWKHTQQQPRVVVILVNICDELGKLWIAHQRKQHSDKQQSSPPSEEELHDAIAWLLVQFSVECILVKHAWQVCAEVVKATRMISHERYYNTHQTASCALTSKIASSCDALTASDQEQARDCWLRMAQQIPRVSFAMARHLTAVYPTARSLWMAYQNESLTQDEKISLVEHCFGNNHRQAKISGWLYTVFTSTNAEELLL
jgi:hypothetical protein